MTYRVTITFSRCGGPAREFCAQVTAMDKIEAIEAVEEQLYEHHHDAAEIELLTGRAEAL